MKGTSSADNTWLSSGKVLGRCKRDASYCSKVRSKVNTDGRGGAMSDPADCFDQFVDGMVDGTPVECGNESDRADPPILPSRTDLLPAKSGTLSCIHARSSSRANLRISSTAISRAVSTTCHIPNFGNLDDFGVPARPPAGSGGAKGLGIDWRDCTSDGVTGGDGLCMI